ncbi:MAG TPA: sulfatase-like hydrolase/transferase [Thermohalobaculum sp.]|nr:sulfatase-like hydrolase/transferase [Thermohalobaculum sp.]
MPGSKRAGGKVLFIVIDQLRADCVTGALAGTARLPHLRALMGESATFASHFTVTNPCGPARASLLTGLYAMNHRSVRNGAPLARHHTNLALEARRAGREPLLFGYTDTSADPEGRHPDDPDLHTYEGLMPGFTEALRLRLESGNHAWFAHLEARGYRLPANRGELYRAIDPEGRGRLDAPTLYRAEDSDTAFLTDETLKALAVRTREDWLAHVCFIRPHPPLAAPAPYNRMHAPESLPPAAGPASAGAVRAVHPFFDAFFAEPREKSLHVGFDGRLDRMRESDRRTLRALYLGLAAEVDHHIGRLIGFLRDSGQLDDSLVIVTADHGEMLGDHCMWGKAGVHDPAWQVPLIVRDPRRRASAGTVIDAFTESIDLAPSILDWLGLEPPLAFNGRSLLPLLDGAPPADWRDHVFMELDLGDPVAPTVFQRRLGLGLAEANLAILRERRFKYVHFNGGLPPLLFDLEADPLETRDLAPDPAFAPELLRLARAMLDHRMRHAHHAHSPMKLTPDGVRTAPRGPR